MKRFIISLLTVIALGAILFTGCVAAPSPPAEAPPEPEIPAHYTTYTDEAALFSISYPPDWQPDLSIIAAVEKETKEWLLGIEPELPIERVSVIFVAGVPTEMGYTPNVNIVVESLPEGMLTLDKLVEATIRGIKEAFPEYREFSRVKTTVGGKEAVIVDLEVDLPGKGRFRQLQMFVLVGKIVWGVGCLTTPEKFGDFEDDFHAIVRSLRIFK